VQFTILQGQVLRHHSDGSYGVKLVNGRSSKIIVVPEHYVFAQNRNRYNMGQEVLSCWTEYALNKNSPQRYKKFKAVIRNVNENGTYSVEFKFDRNRLMYSQCVREMWITTSAEEIENKIALEHSDDAPKSSLCIKVANNWTPRCVGTYLLESCSEGGMSPIDKCSIANAIQLVLDRGINGEEFISMTQEELTTKLGLTRNYAKYFYERFMYWIHIRMEDPPVGAQKKRTKMFSAVPGGGKSVSRRS